MFVKYSQLKTEIDVVKAFEQVPKFLKYQHELAKELRFKKKNSICIDIPKTFLVSLDPYIDDDFELALFIANHQSQDLVVIQTSRNPDEHQNYCTGRMFNEKCCCQLKFFRVRPYTFEFLTTMH